MRELFKDIPESCDNTLLIAERCNVKLRENENLLPAFDVLVNVTPLGMSGGNEGQLSFPESLIKSSHVVFDVIAMPVETPLYELGIRYQKLVITGMEIMASQAAIQFELYTGITLTEDQIKRASLFSRQQS